jgi:predicted RNase H-like HicB family nuclease
VDFKSTLLSTLPSTPEPVRKHHRPIVRHRLDGPNLAQQTLASFDARHRSSSVAGGGPARYRLETMSEPLRLTIVYEDAGDGDGWVVARIPQVRGAISQGATREEARENVIDALRELLAVRFGSPPELPEPADSDSLELTIAA